MSASNPGSDGPLPRKPVDPRGRSRGQIDEGLRPKPTGSDHRVVEQRQARLKPRHPIGDARKVGCRTSGELARRVETVGRMIGRDHLKIAQGKPLPERRVIVGGTLRGRAHPLCAFDAIAVQNCRRHQQVMRAGLGPDRHAPPPRRPDRRQRLAGRDVEQHHRLVEKLGEPAHPLDRFDLGQPRMRQGVVARRGQPVVEIERLGPAQHRIGFGVDADQRARLARNGHQAQDFGVFKADVVSREDLDRPVPFGDEGAQIGFEFRHRKVRHRHMEGVVDHRAPARAGRIILDRRPQRLPLRLRGKGNHRCRAPERRRACRRLERVGIHQAHAGHLLDMGVNIDAPGHDMASRRVDHAGRASRNRSQCGDGPVDDRDIADKTGLGGHDGAAAQDQVEICHDARSVPCQHPQHRCSTP